MKVFIKFTDNDKQTYHYTFEGENQKEVLTNFKLLYPNAVLKEVDSHTPNVKTITESDTTIRQNYDFYRRRYFSAKQNEDVGLYLWGKMSEHHAEMHYLKHQYEKYNALLKERNLEPLTKEVKL